ETDRGQQVPEFLFEGDNFRISGDRLSVVLAQYPDLVVENLKAAFAESGPIEVTWQTANRGTGPAAPPFVERIVLRNLGTGAIVGQPVEQSIPQVLSAGASISRAFSLPRPPSGRYELAVIADARDNLFEFGSAGHLNAEQN